MLPKIEDAGQRAGLLDQFAPKIEDQMESLEKKIQDEEKTENEEKTKVTPISVVSKTKDAPSAAITIKAGAWGQKAAW